MTDVLCDLPIDERPRERLLKHGAHTLSRAELLAIILGSGVQGKNAVQLGRSLLADGMRGLLRHTPQSLQEVCGIGPAKAARLLAAIEICRHMTSDEPEEPPPFDQSVLGPQLVAALSHHTQERLGAAMLDSRHRIIGQHEIYVGTINNALVSTRDIIRHALLDPRQAAAVVVYHNHPSGDPTPSAEDLKFTWKLKDSLANCDIELVDHLIIGAHRYCSLQTKGHL